MFTFLKVFSPWNQTFLMITASMDQHKTFLKARMKLFLIAAIPETNSSST
jgi:hypothetical protein